MMAVNIGPLPGVKVRIVDPPDPKKKNLPMVTYTDDLKERYRQKYGEELMPNVLSLFAGDSEKDKLLRGKYWAAWPNWMPRAITVRWPLSRGRSGGAQIVGPHAAGGVSRGPRADRRQ